MIYLIRSYGEDKSILKIGYTDNMKKRGESYFYHNPLCKVLQSKEGDEIHEILLHLYLSSLGYNFEVEGKLNEWYLDIPEVIEIFNMSFEELCDKVWKSRGKAFDLKKFKLKNYIYNSFLYLFERNHNIHINQFKREGDKIIKDDLYLEVDEVFWKIYSNNTTTKEINLSGIYPEETLKIAQDFLDNKFYRTNLFREKLKMYCEFMDKYQENKRIEEIIYYKIQDDRFRRYYNFYGTKGCSAKKYEERYLYEGMINTTKSNELEIAIRNHFKVGQRYTLKEIKENLKIIYRNLGITSESPKATDLGEYFKLTRTKIQKSGDPKKYSEGFRLESL